MMKKIPAFWRLFEEWAIVFANKLRNNPFLKTQITFICVLFVVSAFNILSLWYVAQYISEDVVEAVFRMWGVGLLESVPSPSFTVLELQRELEQIQFSYLVFVGTLNVCIIIALILIISKVALEPTKDAINAQRNFIGYTAHELRTPLSIARANIEATLLGESETSKTEYVEELKRTITELDALAGIINNLVTLNTLSKLEPAEYHHHDMHDIVNEVAQTYAEMVENKELNFKIESSPGMLVWGNRNALKQMVGNIIGNAISFTPKGKSVIVRLHQPNYRYVRLTVADTGPGILKEDLPYIFKPFYRSSDAQKYKEGSGLGLAIVRELVRLHLGKISIQSVISEGTVVTIDLPVFKRRMAPKRHRAVDDSENKIIYNFSRDRNTDEV